MYKILAIFLSFWTSLLVASAAKSQFGTWYIQGNMWPRDPIGWINKDQTLFWLAEYIRDIIASLIGIVALGVFLYLWFKLISARWQQEEFKKVITHFIYAVIWLACVPLAWGVVKLVSSLSF